MNLPNKLTLLRICLIPLCLLLWALGLPILSEAELLALLEAKA